MEQNSTHNIEPQYELKDSKTLTKLIEDLKKREKKGFLQYGTTVDRNDYDHLMWLQEAYEECLDMAVYLKSAIEKIKEYKMQLDLFDEDFNDCDSGYCGL
jgi:hypothetical protein